MSWVWQVGIAAAVGTLFVIALYLIGDREGRRRRRERERERRLRRRR